MNQDRFGLVNNAGFRACGGGVCPDNAPPFEHPFLHERIPTFRHLF